MFGLACKYFVHFFLNPYGPIRSSGFRVFFCHPENLPKYDHALWTLFGIYCYTFSIHVYDIIYDFLVIYMWCVYIPGTCLSSIFWPNDPSKTRSKVQSKQGSFGVQICIYTYIHTCYFKGCCFQQFHLIFLNLSKTVEISTPVLKYPFGH